MKFLITGGAGFIGSNLAEAILDKGWEVVILDNLSTGKLSNIRHLIGLKNFSFLLGSITDIETCEKACVGVDYVLHHAALCSVPESVENPRKYEHVNVGGTVNVFNAAVKAGVKRVVWASSTSVYGNADQLPNVESMPFNPLSPYAASKASGEMFAKAFSAASGLPVVTLRYFNIFGKRQDPSSAYAAVIPIFISKLLKGESPIIYGDGNQTRDFVYIENVVQANIKAAISAKPEACGRSFNIGCGSSISINELFRAIATELRTNIQPEYLPPRAGDVRDSVADIGAAREYLGYDPGVSVLAGLKKSLEWYKHNSK